jgi:ornithine carrier protein
MNVISAGAIAGVAYNICMYPADTIKSVMQTNAATLSMDSQSVARTIYAQYGLRGFYRGVTPTVLRAMPANAALFYSYESVHAFCLDRFAVRR